MEFGKQKRQKSLAYLVERNQLKLRYLHLVLLNKLGPKKAGFCIKAATNHSSRSFSKIKPQASKESFCPTDKNEPNHLYSKSIMQLYKIWTASLQKLFPMFLKYVTHIFKTSAASFLNWLPIFVSRLQQILKQLGQGLATRHHRGLT